MEREARGARMGISCVRMSEAQITFIFWNGFSKINLDILCLTQFYYFISLEVISPPMCLLQCYMWNIQQQAYPAGNKKHTHWHISTFLAGSVLGCGGVPLSKRKTSALEIVHKWEPSTVRRKTYLSANKLTINLNKELSQIAPFKSLTLNHCDNDNWHRSF